MTLNILMNIGWQKKTCRRASTSSIELTDTNGNVVNNDDGVKNGAGYAKDNKYQVKKEKIKVKKTWKTDENTDGKSVTVHLKAFKGDTNTPLKTSDLSASELNAIRISGSTSPVSISGQDVVITTSLSKANTGRLYLKTYQ